VVFAALVANGAEDQKTINLLEHLQLAKLNFWQREESVFINSDQIEELVLPIDCEGDYEIIAEVRLRNTDASSRGAVGIRIQVPMLEGSPAFHVGGTKEKAFAMYFPLERRQGEKNATIIPIPNGWEPEKWHKVCIRVQGDSVRLILDDNEVFKGSAFPGFPKSNKVVLGCDTGNNEIMVRKWEISSDVGVKVIK